MCGIVGYLGKGEAYPALIKGLKRLEYRGYDSAGVALIGNDGSLNVYTIIEETEGTSTAGGIVDNLGNHLVDIIEEKLVADTDLAGTFISMQTKNIRGFSVIPL